MGDRPVYLAFRVFGNFHWPPVRSDFDTSSDDTSKPLQKGVVEIYYTALDATKPDDLSAFLRWTSRKDNDPATPELLSGDLSAAVDIQNADTALLAAFNSAPQCLFRLTGTAPKPGKARRLLFRGVFLFDQFALKRDPPDRSTLDRRWALARTFQHYDRRGTFGSNFFSEVVIGQDSDAPGLGASIRFNLALPTPGAQSGTDSHRCYALPFCAVFQPTLKLSDVATAPPTDLFMAGPGPADSRHESARPPKGRVADTQLGHFGFCGGKGAGVDKFFFFPRDSGDVFAFWPTSTRAFIDDFLGALSKSAQAGPHPEQRLQLYDKPGGDGEYVQSVRFSSDLGKTVITFRTSATIPDRALNTSGPSPITDDIRIDWNTAGSFRPSCFQLRLPDQPNTWLHTRTDALFVEREISYAIADNQVWTLLESSSPSGGDLTVRLGFAEKQNDVRPLDDTVFLPDIFDRAIKAIPPARFGLRDIMDGQPQSILPDVDVAWLDLPVNPLPEDVPPTPRFMFSGKMSFAFRQSARADGPLILERKITNRKIWAGLDVSMSLWPSASRVTNEKAFLSEFAATMKIVTFPYEPAPLELTLITDPDVTSGDQLHWCRFRLAPPSNNPPAMKARLGGLEFGDVVVFPKDDDNDYSYWRFGYRASSNVAPKLPMANVDFRIRLQVGTVIPIVADTSWGDRGNRSAPLLIPVGQASGTGQFLLDLGETVSQSQDRQLTASLYDRGSGANDSGDFVLLSDEPFSVIRLHAQPLQQRGAQDSALVASFDSDTRQWQMKLTSETYHYALPPQVAGESMDKPWRLQIQDDTTPSYPSAVMPQARPPQDKDGNPFPVEFRLTPSAEIWIRPSDVERGYFLPEWASREIFRQRGDLGIGAALAALRGEFLYGLSVGVDPSRETGASRSARIAEIEALLGRPPSKLGVANKGAALPVRWTALDGVLARRPERLEIWARDVNSSVPLAPAGFSDGVTFSLRRTALHRPPVPIVDGDADDPKTGKPRYSERGGLSGGALWPLESLNFFNSLVENPTSVGGTIEQIALSPIGGDANQTAEFLNGKVRIISETRNGFVQRHKIEIIGRISVFWHWAKYVVVFERTVNPSAQFTPDGGIQRRTRRPVLRKVSEYVYIRQPQGIRRYPDFPAAEASSAGLLKAVKFNSISINVDSAWSEDVGRYGWQIPLWNRDAALRRPQVYPRPDIAFSMFAEGQGEEAETSQECLEPDNIYFYADASPGTGAKTDDWPSLASIDCSQLSPPSHGFQRELKAHGETDTKPGAARIPRGHRRFTWRLSPPSKKTALNAGRSEKPLFAGLESITFMRSNAAESSGTLESAIRKSDQLDPFGVDPAKRLPIWNADGKAPDQFAGLGAALEEFLKAAKDNASDLPTMQAKADALTTELRKIGPTLVSDQVLSKYVKTAQDNAKQLKDIQAFAGNAPQQCEQLANNFVGSIKRKELLIVDAIRTWETYSDPLPAIGNPPHNRADLIDGLANTLKHPLDSALAGAEPDIGRVNVGIERARNVVQGFQDDIVGARDDLKARLIAFKNTYNDGKPWSEPRITDLQTKLLAQGAAAFHVVETAVEEVRVRLSSELTGFAQGIANVVQHLMDAIATAGSDLQSTFTAKWKFLAAYLQEAIKRIDSVLKDTTGQDRFKILHDKLVDLKGQAHQKFGTTYDKRFDDIRTGLDTLKQGLNSTQAWLVAQQAIPASATATITEAVRKGQLVLSPLRTLADDATALLGELQGKIDGDADQIIADIGKAVGLLNDLGARSLALVQEFGGAIDGVVDEIVDETSNALDEILTPTSDIFRQIDDEADRLESQIDRLKDAVGPDAVGKFIKEQVLKPAIGAALSGVTDDDINKYAQTRDRLKLLIGDTSGFVQQQLESLTDAALGSAKDQVVSVCNLVGSGLKQGYDLLDDMKKEVERRVAAIEGQFATIFKDTSTALQNIRAFADGFAADARQISNDIATSYAAASGYGNRVLEAAGNLGSGDIGAVPGNVLRLYAAAASAPVLPNLDFDRERLGYYYKQLSNVIDTTPAEAWFGRLGDELKALGLSLPFQQLGESVIPDDLSDFDISRIFKNFSGMKLDKLFDGYKLPPGAKDAIKLTHAFDKVQARAWVEIDVDLPMTDRKAMFSIGPFELDYVDSRFVAMVRLEASKDTNTVDQTGRATLTTDLEAIVGGETMVTFQQVGLHYEKSSGLKVDFDPKKIRLNAIFQFIEDTLGSIFPDELGGLKIIKEFGIPVGIEHEFAMPPISLNYATSGVSNIAISNRFGLVAFPDFVIYDRFSLSRPELPFIFSIFIIGGTGYISVEAEYHPFRDNGNLMVMVEAAAGGSAQLGFAFGPVSGQVLITLSVALAYRKVFGAPGGGLTVSLVLLIAGNVDIAGIVTIYIGLLLRMSYQDNGAIDATGTLTVTIHITRFFKIEVSANAHYQLRGGQSKTTTSVHAGAGVGGSAFGLSAPSVPAASRSKADRLLSARG